MNLRVSNWRTMLGPLMCLCLYLVPFFTQAGEQPLTKAQQYAVNRAAVVMVRTEVSATVYVRQVTINNSALNKLLDSIRLLEADSIYLSPGQKLDIVLHAFNTRASTYFKSYLTYYRHEQKVSANGTGFIFSSDGYIFTNCHVVNENDDYIRSRFILSAFNYVTESNISSIESAWAIKFSDAQRSSLYQTFADVYSRLVPIVLENLRKDIYVIMSEENEAGEAIRRVLPAWIVQKGESMPGKDVAILKIRNGHEFPVIPISSDDPGRVGEDVFVYGFPDPVSRNTFLSKETMLVPTLTKGIISAWKNSIEGWPVIQMDAIIDHGNSGGPVCDTKGEVIGISTFGSPDADDQGLAPGLNFAIPVSILNEFIQKAAINPKPSSISARFTRALLAYDKGEFRKALREFRQFQQSNPAYPGINTYIAQAQMHIKKGESSSFGLLAYLGLLIIILGISAFGFFVWKNR